MPDEKPKHPKSLTSEAMDGQKKINRALDEAKHAASGGAHRDAMAAMGGRGGMGPPIDSANLPPPASVPMNPTPSLAIEIRCAVCKGPMPSTAHGVASPGIHAVFYVPPCAKWTSAAKL